MLTMQMCVFQSSGDQQIQPHHSHVLPASREDPEGEAGEGGPDSLLQPQQHQGTIQVNLHPYIMIVHRCKEAKSEKSTFPKL